MGFSVPEMPLAVNIWHNLTDPDPPLGVPDLVTVGNLGQGRRNVGYLAGDDSNDYYVVHPQLLLPLGTDIRDLSCSVIADVVEVPAGTGRFYLVLYVDDMGKGFSNEHRFAVLQKLGLNEGVLWPQPIP
jgi:hypothetical protein